GAHEGAPAPDKGAGAGKDVAAGPTAARQFHRRSLLDRTGAVHDDGPRVHAGLARPRKDGAPVHIELALRTQRAVFHINGSILSEGPSAIVGGESSDPIRIGFLQPAVVEEQGQGEDAVVVAAVVIKKA